MFSSYSKPFYNSAQPLRLGCIDKDKYVDFVVKNFDKAGMAIDSDVAGSCYDEFEGYTYYLHRIFHDIFSFSKEGDIIDKDIIKHTIDSILEENSHSYGKTMAELPMAQKQMLAAVAKERPAKNLTSGAFVKRNSLQSSSSAQKAVIKLLDRQLLTYDVTNGEKEYSVSDKFFERWLREVY